MQKLIHYLEIIKEMTLPKETPDHFDFSESMQIGLLRAFCKVEFFEKHFDTAKPEHFENDLLTFLAGVILAWQRKYHADMPKEVLLEEIKRAEPTRRGLIAQAVTDTVDKVYGSKVPTRYLDAQYREWSRHQAMGSAIIKASELYKQHKYADARRLIDDAYFSTDGYELGHMFLGNSENRAKRRLTEGTEKIPTMIQPLDHMLRGGVSRKSFAIIMGKPKKGKSFCLVNIGKGAVVMGYKVSHYTLEAGMPEEKVSDRYDAAFSGIRIDDLPEESERLVAAIEKAKANYGESLVIKAYPPKVCTVDTIRSHQKRLIGAGFDTDVIIVDYVDIMKATRHYEQKWIELTDIFEELSGLAAETNCVVWAASTVHRKQENKRTAHMEDAGGAFNKMFVADIIITLNQDDEEKKQGKMRMFLAAARAIPDGFDVTINTDFEHAQFAKPPAFDDEDEFVKRKDLF